MFWRVVNISSLNHCTTCSIYLLNHVSSHPYYKQTEICPVRKAGNKFEIVNYRPIALISNISKVFESIIFKYIFYSVKNKISEVQHGFFKGRSVNTNLINFVQKALDTFDQFEQLDVIYLDAAKAFDKMSHTVLLSKLKYLFNFSDALVAFLSSYLKNRSLKVKVDNYFSQEFCATSGVPQGSNLGPLLFLL